MSNLQRRGRAARPGAAKRFADAYGQAMAKVTDDLDQLVAEGGQDAHRGDVSA
jgi:hypothetical protein